MKLISSIALLVLMLTSCVTKETPFATIKGRYTGDVEGKEIHLCKVEHGGKTKVATTQIGVDGQFVIACMIENPSLYVLNTVWVKNQQNLVQDHDLKRFYLDKGTELEVTLDNGNYQLLTSSDDKNKLLSDWNNQIDTVFTYTHGFKYNMLDYTHFYPLLPNYVKQAEAFEKKINTGDAKFDELMKLMVKTDMNIACLSLLYTPRRRHSKRDDRPVYYGTIVKNGVPQSVRLLDLPYGRKYLRLYAMYAIDMAGEKPTSGNRAKMSMDKIPNDLLKAYYALDNLRSFRTYDDNYLNYKNMVSPYLINNYLKKGFEIFEKSIRKFGKGAIAFDFSGKDSKGKLHKLSDYKGKLVYVDVWATWCGPCKAEIPYLKALEKKFHNKPIVFMSISLDKSKDYKKWVDFVSSKGLKGVQLIADKAFESDVAKAYEIKGIPRFMLFDKEGKVISIDAPRPSNKKSEEILNEYL